MLKRSLAALVLLIILPTSWYAQDLKQFQTDIQKNTYKIYDQEIVKFNVATHEEFKYSNKLMGSISQLDVTNPLRPLIFYQDVQKLVITDNTLSKQSEQVISFEELGMFQIQCVANSQVDNGIWMYDQELLQIVKFDRTLNKIIETGNLQQLLGISDLSPVRMVEKAGYLYVYCPKNGFLIFDIYGTFYKKIVIDNITVWNIVDQKIMFSKERESFEYNLKDFIAEPLGVSCPKSNEILWIDETFLYSYNQSIGIQKTNLLNSKK